MSTTIPYSPSLVLGSIVEPAVMDNLLAISAAQTPIDAAQETLNSFISMKRSLEMTVQELINMGLDPSRCASAPRWRHKACSTTHKAIRARHSRILNRRADWPATP